MHTKKGYLRFKDELGNFFEILGYFQRALMNDVNECFKPEF